MIARVFPSKTKATPCDEDAYFDEPGLFEKNKGYTKVDVSVTFTWDVPRAKELARQWEKIAPVEIGGPGVGTRGEYFVPGKYIKPGYVITSRGCPNHCWFCSVWKREGDVIRELPICDGWNILDDNLFSCSEPHIRSVFEMLKRQKRRPEFTGGIEAAKLKPWHVDLLLSARPQQFFCAYDDQEDLEPLVIASRMIREAGFNPRQFRTYVLIGYPKDTIEAAEKRLIQVCELGSFPMAMLWKNNNGDTDKNWRRFSRGWARPALISRYFKKLMPPSASCNKIWNPGEGQDDQLNFIGSREESADDAL